MVRFILRVSIVFVVCGPLAAAQSAGREVVSALHGFAFTPPAGWGVTEKRDPTDDGLRVTLQPPSAGGAAGIVVEAKLVGTAVRAELLRNATLAKAKHDRSGRDRKLVEVLDVRVAGRTAPGLCVPYASGDGKRYRIHQFYLVLDGVQITFRSHAPAKETAKWTKRFRRVWKSIRLVPATGAVKRDRTLARLAARCATEIPWAANWADAARRARSEKRPILVYAHRISGFQLTDSAVSGLFMDPDFGALVRSRFVPLRYVPGTDAPFVDPSVYGLSKSTFGTALLVVDPDGRVLDETFTREPTAVLAMLQRVLATHPAYVGPPVLPIEDALERAAHRIDRGELDAGLRELTGVESARAHRLAAKVHRLRLDAEAALAALAKAEKVDGVVPVDLVVERAVIELRAGRFRAAQDRLERVLETHPRASAAPEALYWLGACALRTAAKSTDLVAVAAGAERRKKAARAWWDRLVTRHPGSRWAWRAAAKMRTTTFRLGADERLTWPKPDLLRRLEASTPAPLPIAAAAQARWDARTSLLAAQRSDGSWPCALIVQRASPLASPFTIAVTALAARSLLPDTDDPRVAAAVDRAVAFLLKTHDTYQRLDPPVYFMDYRVWSYAMVCGLLAALIDRERGDAERLRSVMGDLVHDLKGKQRRGGGFSYYVSREVDTTTQPIDESISFVTAAVAHALLDAKQVGVRVPRKLLRGALSALAGMRNPDGTFAYMRRRGASGRQTRAAGAAGRGPLCAHALWRGGRVKRESVRRSLDIFLEHRVALGRERRKSLMHTGADAQGSHYLMFDYVTAAAAVRALPQNRRAKYRDALLEEILAARLDDGSYLDNPMLGRAYGAAMALLAFERLGVSRRAQ